MLGSNVNKLLKACQDEAWCKKRSALLWVLQYAGGIVMVLALIARDGSFFGYKISIDKDILAMLLLAGVAVMFWGYYERKMIELVRAIKDVK